MTHTGRAAMEGDINGKNDDKGMAAFTHYTNNGWGARWGGSLLFLFTMVLIVACTLQLSPVGS